MQTPDGGQLPGLLEERMRSGAVIMIVRSHSARDGASQLIMPVHDGNRRARIPARRRE
jgi:hypothetical protein